MSKVPTDSPNDLRSRYFVLALLCLLAAIAYIQRGAISVPAEEIAGNLGMTKLATDMGWVHSAWYWGYALMQLPGGWLADRIGSRQSLAILSVVWSLATLLSGLAFDFVSLLCLWGLMGAAQAGAFPSAAKAIGQIFPEAERARASGLLAAGMQIGGAVTPVMTATCLEWLMPAAESLKTDRWRLLLAAYAIPGFLWTSLFLLLIDDGILPRPAEKESPAAAPIDWRKLASCVALWLLCAQQFLRAAGMVFFLTWFPTFLQKTRAVSQLDSGILTTVTGIGGVVGSLTGGFFSDWLLARTGNERLSRQGIAVVGMAICSLLIVGSYFVYDVNGSIGLISLGVFFATFGGVSGYTVAISAGGRHTAAVFSTMNMCGNIGAALFPFVAGMLVALTGNWNLMLFLFAGIMALAAICWALLDPRGTLFGNEYEKPASD